MESYSGLLPFLWKAFKKPQQERKPQPELVPLSLHDILEDRAEHQDDDEYFLHPELVTKAPARFAESPSMFGRSPGRAASLHKRRHSTSGLGGFSLPKLLSSHSKRAR